MFFLRTPKKKPAPTAAEKAALVEEIHREFDTASDRALAQANAVIAKADMSEIEKAKVLRNLGFTNSIPCVTIREVEHSLRTNGEIARLIDSYRASYPFNKFISTEDVVKICQKYGLVCGPVGSYVGDVPSEHVKKIQKFSQLKVPAIKVVKIRRIRFSNFMSEQQYKDSCDRLLNEMPPIYHTGSYPGDSVICTKFRGYLTEYGYPSIANGISDVDGVSEDTTMMICAPRSEFNIKDLNEKEGFLTKKVTVEYDHDDPVVLYPVERGFLIVTAWGPEASDPAIVNSINN